MSFQVPASQGDGAAVLNFGWPGPLPNLSVAIHRDSPPVDSKGRGCCRVFLGPNLSPEQYSRLKNLLERFDLDSTQFSGLALTTCPNSLSGHQQQEVAQLAGRLKCHFELRNVDTARGHEKTMKYIRRDELLRKVVADLECQDGDEKDRRTSSSFAIPVDFLNGLHEHEVRQLCSLDNLELVHLLAPRRSLVKNRPTIDPCHNALEVVWQNTPMLKKCILPMDLADHLAKAFEVLSFHTALEELELEAPVSDEVRDFFHKGAMSYEPTMAKLSIPLANLNGLYTLALPISFATTEFLSQVAILPNLTTLILSPVVPINPVRRLVLVLHEAQIRRKGAGCFQSLVFLNLGPTGEISPVERLHFERHVNSDENLGYRRELHTIFGENTFFCGDWLEFQKV